MIPDVTGRLAIIFVTVFYDRFGGTIVTDFTDLDDPQMQSPFERIRQVDPDDYEFWSARDLMPILEYTKWQNFKTVLLKAQIACENSGNDPADHFTDASKMVAIGSDAKREVEDMHLSRYACYLIVQNADPAKEVIALGQNTQPPFRGLPSFSLAGQLSAPGGRTKYRTRLFQPSFSIIDSSG
jgi:hypothetical protein